MKNKKIKLIDILFILFLIFAIYSKFTGVFGINIVQGNSMNKTLHDGEVLFGSSIGEIERGEIVTAHIDYKDLDELVIKRVVGLPGETIACIDGIIYIDGVVYSESYLNEESNTLYLNWGPITLNDDEYFIIGDNRDHSLDSRFIGPINKKEIKQQILFVK